MELLNLAKPSNNRLTSFTVKSSSNNRTKPPHKIPSSPSTGLQFRKLSNKELSKILRTDAAIEAIERKANSSKYNNLQAKPVLEALGDAIRLNRWVSALKIFGLLRKQDWYEPRCQTYVKLLVMLGKCKQSNQAGLLFEAMLSDGLQPTVEACTALLGAYAVNGLFDKALSFLDVMKSLPDCKPDAYTYSTLLKHSIRFHHFDLIDQVLEEMVGSGIECTAVTYNILIDGYGKANRFQLMEDTLTDMIQAENCHPDVFTFNSVVGAYGGRGRIEEMEKWFNEFQAMGLEPDIVTYNILIKSYGKYEMYEKMGRVMDFMRKRFYSPTVVTHNIMIEAFGKAGDIKKMDEFFLKMKHEGVKPTSVTYSSLVNAYSRAGQMGKVDWVLKQIANSNVELDTHFFNCAINAYGKAGDFIQMVEIFRTMESQRCKPDKVTFATMIQACQDQGMVDIARSLETKMIDAKYSSDTS